MQISGWFEPEERYPGIKKLWAEDSAKWKGDPRVTEPGGVTFVEIGKWSAVMYDHTFPKVHSSHLRAEWVQAGTWLDVHISITKEAQAAELRPKLRQLLESIQVTEKPFSLSMGAGKEKGSVDVSKGTSSGDHGQVNLSIGGASTTPRGEYAVPGHGKLILRAPNGWREISKSSPDLPAVSLSLKPPDGEMFEVLITAGWMDGLKVPKLSPEKLSQRPTRVDRSPDARRGKGSANRGNARRTDSGLLLLTD